MDRIEVPCTVLHKKRPVGHIHQQQRAAGEWLHEALGSFDPGGKWGKWRTGLFIEMWQATRQLTFENPIYEGPATKSGLRNPLIENAFIGLSCGADQCGFN